MAYVGAGPGRLMRRYCLRVRVVVGTNTAASPRSVRSWAAVSVMKDSGLLSWTSTHSSRGARGSGIVRARAAAE